MKWTEHLMKWARSPQNENKVKFIPQMPLALRNHITGKGSIHKGKKLILMSFGMKNFSLMNYDQCNDI